MRVLLLVLALTLICAAAGIAQMGTSNMNSQPASVGAGSSMSAATSATTGEEVMSSCVMQCYGVNQQTMNSLRAQGLTNADIAMASAISARANVPIIQVVTEWQQSSKDWTSVAKMHNLSMSDLTMMPAMASADEESFNQVFFSNYYGIPTTQVASLRAQGYSWSDINMMANASARAGVSIQQIASMRAQGMSWASIAQRYNLTADQLMAPIMTRQVATTSAPYPPSATLAGAGPTMPAYIYDRKGNVILNQTQVYQLYAQGYDWLDIAVASNIAEASGFPMSEVLSQLNSGQTWMQIATEFGVTPEIAFNVSNYPFPRRSVYSQKAADANMQAIQQYQKPYDIVTPCGVICAPTPACVPAQPVCPPAQPVCPPAQPVCPPAGQPMQP